MRYRRVLALIIALVVIISLLMAIYLTLTPTKVGERHVIGLITLEGAILYDSDARRYLNLIWHATENSSIKAVVIYVNSPGGYANLIESIYLSILSLKKVKPVVCVAQLALSGGYYIAVAADYIYVYPTSYVGNVGVIGVGPPILVPSETVLETGPYKATGFSRLLFSYNIAEALNNFLNAVEASRGGKMKINRSELSKGLIYIGSEAVKLGLVDSIGSLNDAIRLASERAGIKEYEVIDLATGLRYGDLSPPQIAQIDAWKNLSITILLEIHPPPTLYYLYLPPQLYAFQSSLQQGPSKMNATSSYGGRVIVDISHGNAVSWIELDVLAGKLAERGVSTSFVIDWRIIEGIINNASALIVAAPKASYSDREIKVIEEYVEGGGILLLLYDPSVEYAVIPSLAYPINTLASKFGIYFAGGYLYNQIENFGFYRNIYAYISGDAYNNPLTINVSKIALFTATHIYSSGIVLAYASNGTCSSMAEETGKYAVAVYLNRGNGTIIAFGDISFLEEPYCHVADNLKIIENLVSVIASNTPPAQRKASQPEATKYAEINEPNIPVGTEKEYLCIEDGEKYKVLWIKVSEKEISVIYPWMTVLYQYDEEGRLLSWTSDDAKCIYLEPIPKPPYPLFKDKEWRWRSNYTIIMYGVKYAGFIEGYFRVEDIEMVKAAGSEYVAAKIQFRISDSIYVDSATYRSVSDGFQWICSEIGHLKEEDIIRHYINGLLQAEIKRVLVLENIRFRALSSSKHNINPTTYWHD